MPTLHHAQDPTVPRPPIYTQASSKLAWHAAVPTGEPKPPSTTAKERNDLPMVGPPNRLGRTHATVDTG